MEFQQYFSLFNLCKKKKKVCSFNLTSKAGLFSYLSSWTHVLKNVWHSDSIRSRGGERVRERCRVHIYGQKESKTYRKKCKRLQNKCTFMSTVTPNHLAFITGTDRLVAVDGWVVLQHCSYRYEVWDIKKKITYITYSILVLFWETSSSWCTTPDENSQ